MPFNTVARLKGFDFGGVCEIMICACPACGEKNSVTAVVLQVNSGESKCTKCTRLFNPLRNRLPPAEERRYKRECAEINNKDKDLKPVDIVGGQLLVNQFSGDDTLDNGSRYTASSSSVEGLAAPAQFTVKDLKSDSKKQNAGSKQSIPWPDASVVEEIEVSRKVPVLDWSAEVVEEDKRHLVSPSNRSGVVAEEETAARIANTSKKLANVRRLEERLKEEKIALEYHKLKIERNKLRLEQQKIELQQRHLDQYAQRQNRDEQVLFQQDAEYRHYLNQYSTGNHEQAHRDMLRPGSTKVIRAQKRHALDTGSIYRKKGGLVSDVLPQTDTAIPSRLVSPADRNAGIKLEMAPIAVSECVIRQSAVKRTKVKRTKVK